MKRVLGALLILAIVILTLAVQASLLRGFDYAGIGLIQGLLPRWLDVPFSIQSLLGSLEISTALLLVLSLLIFKPSYRLPVIVIFFLFGGIEWLGKHLIYQPGPPAELSRYIFFFGMPTGGIPTPFSFPSGHAARATFLFVILLVWLARSRLARSIKLSLLALLTLEQITMLIGRIDLGDHWPSDVIGGLLLGTAAALPLLAGLTGALFPITRRSIWPLGRRSQSLNSKLE